MTEWFADDEFWEATYPFMFPESSLAAGECETGQLMALSGCESDRLLDLCCGPGRHAVPLRKAGFDVTGVDRSQFLLEQARAYAADQGIDVEWVRRDMREFVRSGSFDLAICMFTSFGFFEDASDNLRVLENVFRSLRPGGCFVLDVMGKERIARVFAPVGATEHPEAGTRFERRSVADDWSKMDNTWTLVKDGVARDFHLRHWLYSGQELKAMLLEAGFPDVRLVGDLSGAPYGPGASRLIAVARKP